MGTSRALDKGSFCKRLELKNFLEIAPETPGQIVMIRGDNKFILNDDGFTYISGEYSSTKIGYDQASKFLDNI